MDKTWIELQRSLEKKYGVTPYREWVNLCASHLTVNGNLCPIGREFVFKCADSGVVCGAGFITSLGLMKFSACYGSDPYADEITGLKIGEKVLICNPNGKVYDYHPTVIYNADFSRIIVNDLFY
jgi:hypothetical protein